MTEQRFRPATLLILVLIMALSAYLRLAGITWALESGYGHYLNYQPDEFISMRGMLPIQLLEGKLKAPGAYFEGTFNYYLWSIPEMVHRIVTDAPALGSDVIPVDRCAFILLSSRLMTVAFDVAVVPGLFFVIFELTGLAVPALVGSLLYGILPMQVIYAHFMRTHLLSNLLCVAVIGLSLLALKYRHWWLYLAAGVVAGLGGATRYPIAVILNIPFFLVLFASWTGETNGLPALLAGARRLLIGPVWLLAAGFLVGLFLGAPMLFLDFHTVVHTISTETLHYVPAGATRFLDLKPLWQYFSFLIPYATYPFLWLLLYLSALLVPLRRSLWPVVVPLFLFAALYTYPMSKGYIVIFARQVMLLLPIFCIFFGLATKIVFEQRNHRAWWRRGYWVFVALLILPSLLFDLAYGRAMGGRDVRTVLRNDLRASLKDKPASTIGVSESGGYFYTAMPAAFPLNGERVKVRLQTPSEMADLFVIGYERSLTAEQRAREIKRVEKAGVFRFFKAYSRAPRLFGKQMDLSSFPLDMSYPFPSILLFRKVSGADGEN